MQVKITLEVRAEDGSSPFPGDIERELTRHLNYVRLQYYDGSLARDIRFNMYVEDIEVFHD